MVDSAVCEDLVRRHVYQSLVGLGRSECRNFNCCWMQYVRFYRNLWSCKENCTFVCYIVEFCVHLGPRIVDENYTVWKAVLALASIKR